MLFKKRAHLDIRKYFFSFRVVDIWNSLPPCVISAKSARSFEGRLDKFWGDQTIKYDYKAPLSMGLSLGYSDDLEEPELVSQD